MLDPVLKAKRAVAERDFRLWGEWTASGNVSPVNLGYGKGAHARLVAGPPSGSVGQRVNCGDREMRVERALWRYKERPGNEKEWMDVQVFHFEYAKSGMQSGKADQLRISIATYKRRLKRVRDYLLRELYE